MKAQIQVFESLEHTYASGHLEIEQIICAQCEVQAERTSLEAQISRVCMHLSQQLRDMNFTGNRMYLARTFDSLLRSQKSQ
jgi:hypothetical protein